MWAGVKVTTAPTALPIDAAALRVRLRLSNTGDQAIDDEQNALMTEFIETAVAMIDGAEGIGVAIMRQTWSKALDCFSPEIELPGSPVVDVAAVRYLDPDGEWQVVDPSHYRLTNEYEPAILQPASGQSWPSTSTGRGVVVVDYRLGADTPETSSKTLKTAVSLIVGHLWENREATTIGIKAEELPIGVQYLLDKHSRIGVAG